jgi:hypothetical protein
MRFEEGKSGEAIDDIVAAITLARHLTQDGTLVVMLLGYNMEPRMSELLAVYLPKLEPSAIKALKTRIDALPPGGRPAQAMNLEQRDMEWFVQKIKDAKDENELLELLSLVAAPEGSGPRRQEASRALLKECGGTAEGVVKLHEQLFSCFERMTKIFELPLDQFEQEWKREEATQTGNPMFKRLFGAYPKLRQVQARTDVRRALLSAALAVQLGGRAALAKQPDPVVGGRFGYTAFKGGFELRSKLTQTDNKPVSLSVGRRQQ